MDELQAARLAWDRARDMVVTMLDRDRASLDAEAFRVAEVAEHAARRVYYLIAAERHGFPLPYDRH